jgi:hypothetical protein
MNIFLSHARKDAELARQLAEELVRAGFEVWNADEKIEFGDNWAKKIGKALENAEAMVILLTPKALESDLLRQDIDFALASRKFENRFFSVYVGRGGLHAGKDMPWILLKLPNRLVESADEFDKVVREIRRRFTSADVSHSHA